MWYKDCFNHMVSQKNLLRCWHQFCKGKKHKLDIQAFAANLNENIIQLSAELQTGSYQHGSYSQFYVFEPKMRRISKATVRDRLVHHMLTEVLTKIFDNRFIFHSYASRKGKGTHQGVIDLQRVLYRATQNNTRVCYFLKCDIKQFFDTANQDILFKLLKKHIQDLRMLNLLGKVIYSYSSPTSSSSFIGLPIGNVTSQIFSNIYMNELDQYIKHHLKLPYYLRYTDDFILLSPHKALLNQYLGQIHTFLTNHLQLTLHPQKIMIAPHIRGIDWVGYNLFFDHRLLRTKTKKRMFTRLMKRLIAYANQHITLLSLRQTVASYLGMLCHATQYKLSIYISNLFGIKLPVLKRTEGLFFLEKFKKSPNLVQL